MTVQPVEPAQPAQPGQTGQTGTEDFGELTSSARNHRFADPAWTRNPLLRRVVQVYLATAATVEGLVAGLHQMARRAVRRADAGSGVAGLLPVPTPGRRARQLPAVPLVSSARMVSVGRRRLRVAIRPGTDPTRPPLLLCNGIGAGLDLLEPFVDEVDPAIEVIRFDPPGVGESPVPPLPYPFIALARLVGRMLDTLGYHRFDVLGISWGGGLAQQLAFQNPRRCRRLVLVATATGCLMVPAGPRTLLRMATPRRYWDADYARSIAGHIYGGTLRTRPDLVKQLILDLERPSSGRGYLYQLAAGAGWTSLPFLPLIRQPTLILAGDDDPIIPLVNARIMARLLPAAQLHVYPDGHLGLVTMKDELATLVSEFIRRP